MKKSITTHFITSSLTDVCYKIRVSTSMVSSSSALVCKRTDAQIDPGFRSRVLLLHSDSDTGVRIIYTRVLCTEQSHVSYVWYGHIRLCTRRMD